MTIKVEMSGRRKRWIFFSEESVKIDQKNLFYFSLKINLKNPDLPIDKLTKGNIVTQSNN
jgi:hypothetical protein